jgi:anti-sigma factor RsiW
MLQNVIAGHVRSLMVNHLTDVASSDRHTVKPWFEGSLDFSPPVPDLTTQGFPLIGGRLDYLASHPVAALVYRRHQHAINLFIWPITRDTPRQQQHVTRQGYNLITWTTADLAYWAISTLNMAELKTFVSMVASGK